MLIPTVFTTAFVDDRSWWYYLTTSLLALVMNLCSWVTLWLFLRFSAAFRNFCPSPPLECTGKEHQTKFLFYPARALRALGLLLADGTPTVGGGKTF